MKYNNNNVTNKFATQANNTLNDERFNAVQFAIAATSWNTNAQIRLFNGFAAYATMMAEYSNNHFVQSGLEQIGKICADIKLVLDEHIAREKVDRSVPKAKLEWQQDALPGMEYVAV